MPTGYTAKLYEGEQTFEEFVWRCARMMGALVTMREDSLDAPIPDVLECDTLYYEGKVKSISAELGTVRNWTEAEANAQAQRSYTNSHAKWAETRATCEARQQRYEQMLRTVLQWRPPTEDHMNFKSQMVEQLQRSMTDCSNFNEPVLRDGAEFKAQREADLERDLDYCIERLKEDLRITAERNQWLDALRQSVPVPTHMRKGQ